MKNTIENNVLLAVTLQEWSKIEDQMKKQDLTDNVPNLIEIGEDSFLVNDGVSRSVIEAFSKNKMITLLVPADFIEVSVENEVTERINPDPELVDLFALIFNDHVGSTYGGLSSEDILKAMRTLDMDASDLFVIRQIYDNFRAGSTDDSYDIARLAQDVKYAIELNILDDISLTMQNIRGRTISIKNKEVTQSHTINRADLVLHAEALIALSHFENMIEPVSNEIGKKLPSLEKLFAIREKIVSGGFHIIYEPSLEMTLKGFETTPAFYDEKNDIIVIKNNDLGLFQNIEKRCNAETLIHELIHKMQNDEGTFDSTFVETEAEAITLQLLYMVAAFGIKQVEERYKNISPLDTTSPAYKKALKHYKAIFKDTNYLTETLPSESHPHLKATQYVNQLLQSCKKEKCHTTTTISDVRENLLNILMLRTLVEKLANDILEPAYQGKNPVIKARVLFPTENPGAEELKSAAYMLEWPKALGHHEKNLSLILRRYNALLSLPKGCKIRETFSQMIDTVIESTLVSCAYLAGFRKPNDITRQHLLELLRLKYELR